MTDLNKTYIGGAWVDGEALAVANDTNFGLSSGICTGSLKQATAFKRGSMTMEFYTGVKTSYLFAG